MVRGVKLNCYCTLWEPYCSRNSVFILILAAAAITKSTETHIILHNKDIKAHTAPISRTRNPSPTSRENEYKPRTPPSKKTTRALSPTLPPTKNQSTRSGSLSHKIGKWAQPLLHFWSVQCKISWWGIRWGLYLGRVYGGVGKHVEHSGGSVLFV